MTSVHFMPAGASTSIRARGSLTPSEVVFKVALRLELRQGADIPSSGLLSQTPNVPFPTHVAAT
ncbi:MAG: hypothetical protein QOG85_635 [Gaiellaceae bacterium]|nr:hypothetical protein [Gaiellaceae bacterium]